MEFRTQISISKCKNALSYESTIFAMGSCFAENMSEKLDYFKFQNEVNPFGIIFNPVSIERIIYRIINKTYFTEQDIFLHNDLWQCYEVHSQLSHPNKLQYLDKLNQIIDQSYNHICAATHFIFTYGTSWVYRDHVSNDIVANCHKVPSKEFTKHLLTSSEIEVSITNTINLIRQINATCSFTFTISPVRHLKDGFVENNVSKSHLISALFHILDSNENAEYFPSYEIMIDELRDYRFYKEDMLHPNQTAIDYIWQQFKNTHITVESYKIMDEVETIQKGLTHRSFHPNSNEHLKFIKNLNEKKQALQERFPFIKF